MKRLWGKVLYLTVADTRAMIALMKAWIIFCERWDKLASLKNKQQSWALSIFLNFFNNKKWFFAFVIKLIWLGVGFLNRTGAEIGYWDDKKCKQIIFYEWKNVKIPKVPSFETQSWALSVFFYVFNDKKRTFAFFIKFAWLGVDFLNRTGAEIGYWLDKKMQTNHFLFKNVKIPKVGSSVALTVRSMKPFCRAMTVRRAATLASRRPLHRWALPVFINFFTNKKWFFAFFIKLIWLGVGFLNRTGAEIGY